MDVVIPRRTRRTHSEAFKRSVVSACREPGVSVAGIALANGLNANQVHRWMRERGIEPPSRRMSGGAALTALADASFVPVQVASPVEALSEVAPGPLAVLIGPEGGFDAAEREHLRARPYVVPISLGPRVMRADTAAVAALALVNAVLGDWR